MRYWKLDAFVQYVTIFIGLMCSLRVRLYSFSTKTLWCHTWDTIKLANIKKWTYFKSKTSPDLTSDLFYLLWGNLFYANFLYELERSMALTSHGFVWQSKRALSKDLPILPFTNIKKIPFERAPSCNVAWVEGAPWQHGIVLFVAWHGFGFTTPSLT